MSISKAVLEPVLEPPGKHLEPGTIVLGKSGTGRHHAMCVGVIIKIIIISNTFYIKYLFKTQASCADMKNQLNNIKTVMVLLVGESMLTTQWVVGLVPTTSANVNTVKTMIIFKLSNVFSF